MPSKILVPLDASETAQAAAAHAIGLARQQSADLRFLAVVDFGSFVAFEPNAMAQLNNDVRQMLDGWMQQATDVGLHASTVIAETSPEVADIAHAIVAEAQSWGSDLIVFGSHGHNGLHHLLRDSVTDGVAHLSSIPVLRVQKA